MKVYQVLNQRFYTDEHNIDRACGMCLESGYTFSSKTKAEKYITEILEEHELSWKDVNLFPQIHFEIRNYPAYNGNRAVRTCYWLNEIDVL